MGRSMNDVMFSSKTDLWETPQALFEELNLPEISLGKLIMRADTALTAALFGIIQEVSDD